MVAEKAALTVPKTVDLRAGQLVVCWECMSVSETDIGLVVSTAG